ncbi:M10 family metallopeptidase C-terminal domain-containing protein [Mangrovicoccus ximenensis]|uniref:M10 family metallopeptidase C-terminal domain-containing protein n=1 Tax=Mangrovicoccus ximenensis TaxID=1911570 RepID=UPI000D34D1D8|nr:hypothetical protein [Mangrovicoccus ximenensis]
MSFRASLDGGFGADTLAGGAGDDLLTGGGGADVFVFAPGGGRDTVTDFDAGADLLDLAAFALDGETAIDVVREGDDLVIGLAGSGGAVLLRGAGGLDPEEIGFLL